jgi:glycerol-1-phosphate dehydrogenase [NAD(P)+]
MPRSIDIPRLVHVGDHCAGAVAGLLERHEFDTSRVFIGLGGGPSGSLGEKIADYLRETGATVTLRPELNGRLDLATEIAGDMARAGYTTVLGVGGGRVIDTAKFAAARVRTDFVSVPTAISHDGISSPVASLSPGDGRRRSYPAAMPAGIIVDIEVIASAPARTLRAGVGDLVSNLAALLDWELADRAGRERYDAYSALIAENAARSVLVLDELESRASHERLAKGLLMSGLAMAAAGTSRPCSGSEHLISHALDQSLGDRAAMHGEQVALGSLLTAAAHESPLLGALRDLYRRLGMPTDPEELSISRGEMVAAIAAAPSMRPDRYTVLSDFSLDESSVRRLLDKAFPGGA